MSCDCGCTITYPPYQKQGVFRYIANLYEAENALRRIYDAEVGFDTEFADPPTNASIPAATTNGISWERVKLCIVQVAVPGVVYIIDVKRMAAFPSELRRILQSPDIAKVGFGLANDARVLGEVGEDVQNFVELGLMPKFANPEAYMNEPQTPISLARAVQVILGKDIDKDEQKEGNWTGFLTPKQIQYAGLDAQASLEVYFELERLIEAQGDALGRPVPKDWYTFDARQGRPTRRQETVRGEYLPWSPRLCPWWALTAQFHGYFW
ncbi:ribonuclease H-like domain-containing protein [Mycena galericulata]|nr:ribonuclease H-like domain-containing protein [Mycena galericulata]KAJ7453998.1 ribonuclease H-like domain-containing protein [Mycena galericulata]